MDERVTGTRGVEAPRSGFTDPLVPARVPEAVVAAAFTDRRADVTVLAGSRLGEWLDGQIAVRVDAELRQRLGRWEALLVKAANGSRRGQREGAADGELVRRHLRLPASTVASVSAVAAARGMTFQDAAREALVLWAAGTASSGNGDADRSETARGTGTVRVLPTPGGDMAEVAR